MTPARTRALACRSGVTLTEALVAMAIFAVVSSIAVALYLQTRRIVRAEASRGEWVASDLSLVNMLRRDAYPAMRVVHRLGPFRSGLRTLILEVPTPPPATRSAANSGGTSGHRYIVYHPLDENSSTVVRSVYASPFAARPLQQEVVAEDLGDLRFAYDARAPEDARLVHVSLSGRRREGPREFEMTFRTAFCLRNAGAL